MLLHIKVNEILCINLFSNSHGWIKPFNVFPMYSQENDFCYLRSCRTFSPLSSKQWVHLMSIAMPLCGDSVRSYMLKVQFPRLQSSYIHQMPVANHRFFSRTPDQPPTNLESTTTSLGWTNFHDQAWGLGLDNDWFNTKSYIDQR